MPLMGDRAKGIESDALAIGNLLGASHPILYGAFYLSKLPNRDLSPTHGLLPIFYCQIIT